MNFHFEIKQLKLRHPWTIARGTSETKQNVFVRLEHEGLTGYGEAAPNIRYAETAESTLRVCKLAVREIREKQLSQFQNIATDLRTRFPSEGAATTAIGMAILDWFCKSLGVPLAGLFGLDPDKAPATTYSIGISKPETLQEKVHEAEQFPVLKIKLGTRDDEEIIRSIRAVTSKPLRVDANEGWRSKEEAARKIDWLATEGVEFVEQPMPSAMLEETAWVRERTGLPLMADESVMCAGDIPKLAGAFDGINIKLMKAGGIIEAVKMIWMAQSLGMKTMLGCMVESSLAISAAAALSPLVDYADLDGNLLILDDPFDGVHVRDGRLILNDRPGVGAIPVEE